MPTTTKASRRRPIHVELIAPALVLLAQGAYVTETARTVRVSNTTILNWMDWAWKHRRETESYLREHYPELSEEELAALWTRIERRQIKRRRRLELHDVLSKDESDRGGTI